MRLEDYGWKYRIWHSYKLNSFYSLDSKGIDSRNIFIDQRYGTAILIDLYSHGKCYFMSRLSMEYGSGYYLIESDGTHYRFKNATTLDFALQRFSSLEGALSFIFSFFKKVERSQLEKNET